MFNKLVASVKKEIIINRYPIVIFSFSRLIIIAVFILTSLYEIGIPSFAQWDAKSYLSIAENGYTFNGSYKDEGSFIAFYPLFPLLVKIMALLGISFIYSALIINFILGLLVTILLYKISVSQFGEKAGISTVFLFSFFPTSIFLSAPYTEVLFLLLSVSSLFLIDKKEFLPASIFTGFALVTKPTGLVVFLILIFYLIKNKESPISIFIYLLISCIPFSLFMLFQYEFYSTPFAFMIAQKINWYHEATFPWVGLSNFLRYVFSPGNFSIMWKIDFFFLTLMIITLLLARKTVKPIYLLFGWGVVLLTLSQTFILGLSRYMLVVIPFYMYWGKFLSERPIERMLIFCLFSSWLVFNTILFILSKNIF